MSRSVQGVPKNRLKPKSAFKREPRQRRSGIGRRRLGGGMDCQCRSAKWATWSSTGMERHGPSSLPRARPGKWCSFQQRAASRPEIMPPLSRSIKVLGTPPSHCANPDFAQRKWARSRPRFGPSSAHLVAVFEGQAGGCGQGVRHAARGSRDHPAWSLIRMYRTGRFASVRHRTERSSAAGQSAPPRPLDIVARRLETYLNVLRK